jgi:hypothetical protein
MGLFRRWWADEPARFWAALTIFINAVLAFIVSRGWLDLTTTDLALLYLVVLSGAALVGGEDVRRRVTPTGTEPAEDG